MVEAGQEVTVLGWGKDSDSSGGISTVLQYLQVEAVSNEDCNAVYGVITEGNGCIEGPSTCNVISCPLLTSPSLISLTGRLRRSPDDQESCCCQDWSSGPGLEPRRHRLIRLIGRL